VPSNKIAQKAVEYVLDPRNTKRMTTTLQGKAMKWQASA
jgi:hypothetical protein